MISGERRVLLWSPQQEMVTVLWKSTPNTNEDTKKYCHRDLASFSSTHNPAQLAAILQVTIEITQG